MPLYIQDRFVITQDGKTLSDALILPKSEYEQLTPEQIETLKQERFTNWRDAIENPPVQKEVTSEEKIADITQELASLDEQKALLLSQKTELEAVKTVKGVR